MLLMILFLSHHLNVASHFNQYAKVLQKHEIPYKVITDTSVSEQYETDLKDVIYIDIETFDLNELKESINDNDTIISGSNSPYWKDLYQLLSIEKPYIKKYVYYDNPERFVPGGYSEKAEEIFSFCEGIIFSNTNHVISGVENKNGKLISNDAHLKYGTGYYPLHIANLIKDKRTSNHTDKKILVYTGGANNQYYFEAFPHFLSLLENCKSNLENFTIILQQHPRSIKEGNIDGKLLSIFKRNNPNIDIRISNTTTIDTLSIADAVLYHQTSMAPQFIFADIEKVGQIGLHKYVDTLVETGTPSITSTEELLLFLRSDQDNSAIKKSLNRKLGISSNYESHLLEIITQISND